MKRKVFLAVTLFALMAIGVFAQTNPESDFTVAAVGSGISITGYKGTSPQVSIPDKIQNKPVTEIGKEAFKDKSITSVTIPNSITTIGPFAFMGCKSLTNITIPNSVTTIEEAAFYGCTILNSITIPASVTKIGGNVFYACPSLTSVTFQVKIASGGVAADAFDTIGDLRDQYLVYPTGGAGIYTRPSGTSKTWNKTGAAPAPTPAAPAPVPTGTAGLAFTAINNNKEYSVAKGTVTTGAVVIPATYNNLPVTALAEKAFTSAGITGITIPEGVKSIGVFAFNGCNSLASVTLPNSLTTIENDAFSGCPKLTSITIPNSVKSIGNAVFYGSTGLTSITIPSSVTNIGANVFYNCASLTSITFQGKIAESGLDANVFNGLGDLRAKYIAGGAGTYTRPDGKSTTWTKK